MRTRTVSKSVRPAALLLTVLAGLLVFAGPASAHQVTSINVDCYLLTAHFSDFPEAGVVVHMAATVNDGTPVSHDVLVTSETTEATLDISSATANLFGTLTIQADITWRYQGWQHVHRTLTATCATPTSTTTTTTTTTLPITTTTAPATTTTLGEQGATTVPTTARPTTTTTAAVSPVSTSPTSGVSPTATLPRTGSDPTFPTLVGLGAVAAGVLALRRRGSWTT